jgi:hypothetical protein
MKYTLEVSVAAIKLLFNNHDRQKYLFDYGEIASGK